MFGHFFALIIDQGIVARDWYVSEFSRESLSGTHCIRPLHAGQVDPACRSLHQGADRLSQFGPLDEIAFPVARHVRAGISA